jgi:hypothetical protein
MGMSLIENRAGPQSGVDPTRGEASRHAPESRSDRGDADRHEDQATRELRDGFATQRDPDHHHRHHGPDHSPEIDDDMDMGM